MKQLRLRAATPEDAKTITEWLNQNPFNQFDPAILQYPTLRVICSSKPGGEPVAFLPSQKALILESLAVNPSATPLDSAQAMRDLTKAYTLYASTEGIREIYILDGGGGVDQLAQHHGFEQLNYRLYRMKLP